MDAGKQVTAAAAAAAAAVRLSRFVISDVSSALGEGKKLAPRRQI